MPKSKQSESVRVVVRCRPFNRKEETTQCDNILDLDPRLGRIILRNPKAPPEEPRKVFTFDSVYGFDSRQREIYDDAVRPLVDSVLEGFNGTIFAYGQTGTGKTHTMQGVSNDPDLRGIIPNSFEHIFTQISRTQNRKFLVRSSYLEIYQEEIRDLLSRDRKLDLKENPETGVYVKDLSSVVTKNAAEIEHVMEIGNRSRSVGFTKMNERSSRSHAIFVVTVECSEIGPDGEDHIRVGKLNMVDLAGSERQTKTGAKGTRLKEATKINLSLSALGNVISALVDKRSSHVPYRDSKLTRLLQDSLGGNAKTVMVATLGPAGREFDESLATLRYASRAKNIKNKPRVNEDPKDALLREFQLEIQRLKAQLEERGLLQKERRRRRSSRRFSRSLAGPEEEEVQEEEQEQQRGEEKALEEQPEVRGHLKDDPPPPRAPGCHGNGEKLKHLKENRKSLVDWSWDQDALEKIIDKYKAMESKLLVGGKTIIDHTNEQQKMLEIKRQEISEQIRREREIQQHLMLQDEETLEIKETFTTLQQEVEHKTKKLKRLYAKLQLVKAEVRDVMDEHVITRQELEQTQTELTRELKYKYLLIENFIPPEEKNKMMNRLTFDGEEDQWRLQPVLPDLSEETPVRLRPLSAVGYKRPISQYAHMAVTTATGAPSRYQAENIMLLELDVTPPTLFTLNLNAPHLDLLLPPRDRRNGSPRVRKSQSWYQAPLAAPIPSSSSSAALTSSEFRSSSPSQRHRPSSASFLPPRTSP